MNEKIYGKKIGDIYFPLHPIGKFLSATEYYSEKTLGRKGFRLAVNDFNRLFRQLLKISNENTKRELKKFRAYIKMSFLISYDNILGDLDNKSEFRHIKVLQLNHLINHIIELQYFAFNNDIEGIKTSINKMQKFNGQKIKIDVKIMYDEILDIQKEMIRHTYDSKKQKREFTGVAYAVRAYHTRKHIDLTHKRCDQICANIYQLQRNGKLQKNQPA